MLGADVSTSTACMGSYVCEYCVHHLGVSVCACTCREYNECLAYSCANALPRLGGVRIRRSDKKASSKVFFSAVQGWLSRLDCERLLNVEVEDVSVVGEDGEVDGRGRLWVFSLVVLSKRRCG